MSFITMTGWTTRSSSWTPRWESTPDNAETHLIIGDIYERRRMFDEAIKEYKEALKISPNDKMMNFKLQTALGQRTHK